MSNKVSFKATITGTGRAAISSTGKSASYFLTGKLANDEFFTMKALFVGDALKHLLEHHEDAVTGKLEKPLAFEGVGQMKSNSWESNGKTMRDTFVIVSDAPSPLASFDMEDNPNNGRPSLVGATLNAQLNARVLGVAEAGKKGTLQMLVQEEGSNGYRTYVRYPEGTDTGVAQGDTIEITGRLAWIKGKAWVKPVIGIEADSINANASATGTVAGMKAATSPVSGGGIVEEVEELPF